MIFKLSGNFEKMLCRCWPTTPKRLRIRSSTWPAADLLVFFRVAIWGPKAVPTGRRCKLEFWRIGLAILLTVGPVEFGADARLWQDRCGPVPVRSIL